MFVEYIAWFMQKLLSFVGIGADKKMNCVIIFLLFLLPITVMYLAIYQLLHLEGVSFETMAKAVETTLSCCNFIGKYLVIITNRSKLIYLLDNIKNFSSFDDFNENFQRSCKKELRFIRFVIGVSIISATPSGLFLLLKPFISNELSFVCYKPEWIPMEIFKVMNSLSVVAMVFIFVTLDVSTYILISLLRVQIKIQNHRVSLLCNGDDHGDGEYEKIVLSRMKVLVDFHNFLYRYFITLNEVVVLATLLQLSIFTLEMCFEIYLASRSENLTNICNVLIFLYVISFETVICYCWPASELTEEFSRTSFCLYDSKWYNCSSISTKKSLLIMMMRCQNASAICYRCMFTIDMELCTNAFKTAFSYYTILKTMSQKFGPN